MPARAIVELLSVVEINLSLNRTKYIASLYYIKVGSKKV